MAAKQGSELQGERVAVLITDGVEQVEYTGPRRFLEQHGAKLTLVSPKAKGEQVQGFDHLSPGERFTVEMSVKDARAGKPIAAICHGPWTLIDAGVARGKRMTSWPSIQEDLRNAGASWSGEPVVVDGNLVTRRKPADLPAFEQALPDRLVHESPAHAHRASAATASPRPS